MDLRELLKMDRVIVIKSSNGLSDVCKIKYIPYEKCLVICSKDKNTYLRTIDFNEWLGLDHISFSTDIMIDEIYEVRDNENDDIISTEGRELIWKRGIKINTELERRVKELEEKVSRLEEILKNS